MIAPAWNETELLALFARACDGLSDAAEMARLDQRLVSDARARQLWLEYIAVHGGVVQHLSPAAKLIDWSRVYNAEQVEGNELVDITRLNTERSRGWFTAPLARGARSIVRFVRSYQGISYSTALVALGLLLTLLAFLTLPQRRSRVVEVDEEPQFVAQLTNSIDAQWGVGQTGGQRGSHLPVGHVYRLKSGMVEVTFRSGARVILEGPAEFRFDSTSAGKLLSGKLTAYVPAAGRGFVVATQQGKVVDLGTRFGVDVHPDERVMVHCFRGEVMYVAPNIETLRLTAGQALEHRDDSTRRMVADVRAFVHDLRLHGELNRNRAGLIVHPDFMHNAAIGKQVTQSTSYVSGSPQNAVDGNVKTFTHTGLYDADPWLMIDLGSPHDIDAVVLHNRRDCCGNRLRDVVVEILDADAQTTVFTSAKLNEGNSFSGPPILVVSLLDITGDVVRGSYVRVRRQPLAGDSNDPHALADWRTLSLGEVQVFALPVEAKPSDKPVVTGDAK